MYSSTCYSDLLLEEPRFGVTLGFRRHHCRISYCLCSDSFLVQRLIAVLHEELQKDSSGSQTITNDVKADLVGEEEPSYIKLQILVCKW